MNYASTFVSKCFCGVKPRTYIKASMCSSVKDHGRFQWSLFEKSFNGKWTSPHTYVYNSDNTLIDVLPTTKYELTFYENRTCIWNGTGLRYTNGNKILYLNETNLNSHGMVFLFPGCGGHSYRNLNPNKKPGTLLPIEVNFFNNNTRSMIIIYYKACNKSLELDSIQITPFRNLRNPNVSYSTFPLAPTQKSVEDIVSKMLDSVCHGERYSYEPGRPYFNTLLLDHFNIFPYLSANKNLVKATFDDGLVMVVPKVVPIERHFALLFGAMMNKTLYKQLVINYNIDGNLTKWTYDIYNISDGKNKLC